MIKSPIIPTDVVVHIGAPDTSGKNITVPFSEYIKNVATGEIYPTWPTDSIKANILSEISFTLNRIYNEWYRAQGYNFDITSDPLYDQSFSEDRQFFETISLIVDEIFNNYIVKDSQVQPLFAQYCDGKVTTCSGLSQWGSVTLANQGKNPLEILKYYYGDNIKIIYNAPVEENILSYPGYDISIGSGADFVRLLKFQLNRIGKSYPAIPIITSDSIYFDLDTENAVKKFQEIFDLDVTGVVDKTTWYKIKYLYNAVKNIANLYSEGISSLEVELKYPKTLQVGSSGEYILLLHYLLDVIAYFDQDIPFYRLDGDTFNDKTKEMVIAFQNKYKLSATGVVDVTTWKDIREAYRQTLNVIPKEYFNNINEFFSGRFLTKGMSGEDVLNLQRFLYIICSSSHKIPGVIINGIYDDLTEQSVKAIQKMFDLTINGVVGASTWVKIVGLANELKDNL